VLKTLDSAVSVEFQKEYPELCKVMADNNEVFAAFKVHDQCERMARLLTGDDGQLRPFREWVKLAEPISDHHNRVWLRTEYDTAVRRAAQARDWMQFREEKDALPNLRWVPSTAATPGADHMVFWNTVRPVDDAFWSAHRPGDRWGCQCSLEATDDPATDVPKDVFEAPDPGLDNNPADDGKLFSDSHPYFPDSCATCPFNTGGHQSGTPTNKGKDCANCSYLRTCLPEEDFVFYRIGKGTVKTSRLIDVSSSDFGKIQQVADYFASMGSEVEMTPKMSRPPKFLYDCYYKNLRGTQYENKCPDLRVDGVWYEHEGFVSGNPMNAFRNMMNHGLKQASRIIIDQPDLTDAYMKRSIHNRISNGQSIDEVWIRTNDGLRLLYKKS